MLAGFIDHLWQSIWFAAIAWGLAYLTRRNSAELRLWLWRIAALKFLVPFSLLFSLGEWLQYPVRHNAVPPPAEVTALVRHGLPLAAPAQKVTLPNYLLITFLVVALIVAVVCIARIARELRRARLQRDEESARMSADWQYRPTPPGFIKAAVVTSVAVCTVAFPIVSGAVTDRLWRQEVLAVDVQRLQSARIAMNEAKPGIGFLSRVIANDQGVMILNINLQDLIALSYGIGQFEVFGGAMPWLESPRYDVQVFGPVRAPAVFDPYSLREPMTNYLYQRFGVSIRVNGSCQEPCGSYESIHVERLR